MSKACLTERSLTARTVQLIQGFNMHPYLQKYQAIAIAGSTCGLMETKCEAYWW